MTGREIHDIRDRPWLSHADIADLNFIRRDLPYIFRRHFREGLRSHIFEVHDAASIQQEQEGLLQDGILVFPRSVPRSMLRLFRHRFGSLNEALEEIRRFQTLESFLSARYIATSSEFLVDYWTGGQANLLLCGLQEYIPGEIFDPWAYERNPDSLTGLIEHLLAVHAPEAEAEELLAAFASHVHTFVSQTKRLISQAGYIPDLSGVGNLILRPDGVLKLVDINNISRVTFRDRINLDDKGYPVCDKSVEVLAILERKLLRTKVPPCEGLYDFFLAPERMARVRELEREFRRQVRDTSSLPAG
jgi:hypothetical protein